MNNSLGNDEMQLVDINDDDNSIDSCSEYFASTVRLNEEAMIRLRDKDPTLTGLDISVYQNIDWENDGIYIAENKNLKSLYLSGYSREQPNKENVNSLLRAISCNRSIRCVNFDNNIGDTGDMIRIIMPFFQNNTNLRTLHVSQLEMDDESVQLLSSALTSCGSLRRLDIHFRVISNMSAGKIVASLGMGLRKLTLLFYMNNTGNQWCIELGKLLQNPTSMLEELNLSNNQICTDGAIVLGGCISPE